MRYWYEDGLIKCMSETCTEECPRYNTCVEVHPSCVWDIKSDLGESLRLDRILKQSIADDMKEGEE